MLKLNGSAALKQREVEADLHLPYLRHLTPEVIGLSTRALTATIVLDGVSFETADAEELNTLHAKLNLLLRNVADDRLAFWTHLVRRRVAPPLPGRFRSAFGHALDAKYRARLEGTDLYRNELFLTLVWHPGRSASDQAGAFLRRLSTARRMDAEADGDDLKRLGDALRDVAAGLERYGARTLSLSERYGVLFSEPMELLHALASGEWLPMPLPDGRIGPALYTNRVIFGREAVEIRSAGHSRFAGLFGIKEYPAATRPGLLDGLLRAPFEFVLTQSFACLAKADAKARLARKQNQLVSARDRAASQIVDLDQALDDLESNGALLALATVLLTVALVEPAAAQFAGVERTLQSIVDVLTGGIARLIAIIAVALCGLSWMFGFMDLRRAMTLIVGIAVVFAASEIVGTLSGGS